jgi:hypothetical protein
MGCAVYLGVAVCLRLFFVLCCSSVGMCVFKTLDLITTSERQVLSPEVLGMFDKHARNPETRISCTARFSLLNYHHGHPNVHALNVL